MDELISTLYQVSDPLHPNYGKHLSRLEAEELVKPHEETVDAVHAWLTAHGIDTTAETSRNSAGDWISVRLPLERVEKMLHAKYSIYQHTQTGERIVRTLAYSLPRGLHDHVDLVQPTTMFDNMRKMHATFHVNEEAGDLNLTNSEAALPDVIGPAGQNISASCNTTITPTCLMQLYRTEGYVLQAADKGNRIGVTGYLEQFVNFVDLQTFYSKFRPDAIGFNVSVISVNGGLNDQSDPGVEANLDNQYTTGLTFPTPNIYYTTPGTAPTINDSVTPPQRDEPYIDWLNFVLSHDDMPFSFTTSYGGDEQTFPKEFAVRACNLFAQLSVRGASVMFSSGDGGVGAGTCLTNDGTNRTLFQPVFPATCPFVTSVGATFHIAPEVGIDFSQGGFSVYFPQPEYQSEVVPPFLQKLGSTYAGLFNPAGRAVPDVSAQGEGFQVVVGGRVESVGGTSASSPTFAAIVTLLNDARIASGKPPLGFLNPLLYSVGLPGFVDILSGNNPGCGTPGRCWDAITGLGTPDFIKLKSLLV
ncbi:subtilisin-like protein [Fomitiporia mediterranea MF3/22]|uniref:subtilisin-like protein n=1 Tax=Fomitiporia mediterranea (strain MF3/22) TaxID=694068 RepID=UPI0004409631|nr:subtilisin-like protein [Fomitiporia mediterranea MF3/22]EJD06097.1 subtilisin-like protein [Fomitiporia mediterranea MF3/22]